MNTIIRLLILLLLCITHIQAGNNKSQALTFEDKSKNTKEGKGLIKPDSAVNIKVYPNPTSEYIKVEGTTEGAELLLYNNKGELLISKKALPHSTQIKISDLGKGTYYLRYRLNTNRFTDKTIVVS
ncbi:MAG: T9SS type A sorting domain-containing protein [Bacteroidia bacterium]|nr:T9SS type A sorting domain-containing protein [Bacteroidia bacterium]